MTPIRIPINRRIVLTGILGMCWIIATRISDSPSLLYTAQEPIPSIMLLSRDGSAVDARTLIGRPSIVTIWASWCPTCSAAMPYWERNAADFAQRDVTFVALNQREPLVTVQRASAAFSPAVTVWADTAGLFMTYLLSTDLPTTAFIDRHGRVVSVVRGPVSAEVVTTMLDLITAP